MVERDATRMCELLVGLVEVAVLGVDDDGVGPLVVHVESTGRRSGCPECGLFGWSKDRPAVTLVDLPCFGRRTRLVWHKHRMVCPDGCPKTWTVEVPSIAASRMAMTDRAGRWACWQVGEKARTVSEVAVELGCDWHTVNDAVIAYGTPLVEDPARIAATTCGLGLDETLFARTGKFRFQSWATSIVDVAGHRLLDIVEGRTASAASGWINERSQAWRAAIRWGILDLSGPYRKAFTDSLPHAVQVADPFHVVKLANQMLDDVRRRVQNETLGHRGRKHDPLYRSRRLLLTGHDRLDDKGEAKLLSLLDAGDPRREVRDAWHVKEVVRSIYDLNDPTVALEFVTDLAAELQDREMSPEVRRLGRTIKTWRTQIAAWHACKLSNGPTEGANCMIKRVKRIGCGFKNFGHYRIRVLLYAGKPNWDLLATVTPR